jgi:Plavaka transposase
LKKIDNLPTQATRWSCDIITSTGDLLTDEGEHAPSERLELWRRDPIECIKELMGNPLYKESLEYAPQRHYMDEEGNIRVFEEMWTGDWWWNTQVNMSTCNSEHKHHEVNRAII